MKSIIFRRSCLSDTIADAKRLGIQPVRVKNKKMANRLNMQEKLISKKHGCKRMRKWKIGDDYYVLTVPCPSFILNKEGLST